MVGFVRNSDTSREAAERISSRVGSLRQLVLEAVAVMGNATCDEIENLLDLTHQTASARIHELAARGLIYDTGRRRLTRSNRNATVYAVAVAKAA